MLAIRQNFLRSVKKETIPPQFELALQHKSAAAPVADLGP
jgi:hypothetical protein